MDNKTESKRLPVPSTEHYFLLEDDNECWVSSDSVGFEIYELPTIDSLFSNTQKPWCEGDSVLLQGLSSDSLKWLLNGKETQLINTSGWFLAQTTNSNNCSSADSIFIKFQEIPKLALARDTMEATNGKLTLSQSPVSGKVYWIYKTDSAISVEELQFNESGFLYVMADKAGCKVSDSIYVVNIDLPSVLLPNAFTPNGDGINDVFSWIQNDIEGTLSVYDRWGEKIYTGNASWDGTKYGEPLPLGKYFYYYQYELNGKQKILKGYITLLR